MLKWLCVGLILMIGVFLGGCSGKSNNSNTTQKKSGWQFVSQGQVLDYYVDVDSVRGTAKQMTFKQKLVVTEPYAKLQVGEYRICNSETKVSQEGRRMFREVSCELYDKQGKLYEKSGLHEWEPVKIYAQEKAIDFALTYAR